MAKRGSDKTQKTLSASKSRAIQRKTTVWTIKDKPGAHNKQDSVPLAFALRNLLQLTSTLKETKKILSQRKIKVNGVVRTEKAFPIGLFDLLEVSVGDEKKDYRVMFDSKRRIKLVETSEKQQSKLCRVKNKKVIKGKKIQFTFNDGVTTIQEIKANLGDTVKLELPSKKIIDVYQLEKGNTAFILGGRHTGKIVKIESIILGTQQRAKIVEFNDGGEIYRTIAKNIFVVGKEKADDSMESENN